MPEKRRSAYSIFIERISRFLPKRVHRYLSNHLSARQMIKTAVANNATFIINMGLLFFLTELAGLHYLISSAIGFVAGTTLSYFINIGWIFKKRALSDQVHLEYSGFILLAGVSLLLIEGLMYSLTDLLGIHYLLSRLIAGWIVFLWDFFARKYILFRGDKDDESGSNEREQ